MNGQPPAGSCLTSPKPTQKRDWGQTPRRFFQQGNKFLLENSFSYGDVLRVCMGHVPHLRRSPFYTSSPQRSRAGLTCAVPPALSKGNPQPESVSATPGLYRLEMGNVRRGDRCIRSSDASSRASRGRPGGPSCPDDGECPCRREFRRDGRTDRCFPTGRCRW